MDSRKYNALEVVSPGQFNTGQRQRLEAFTAAVGLLGRTVPVTDHLAAAAFVFEGVPALMALTAGVA